MTVSPRVYGYIFHVNNIKFIQRPLQKKSWFYRYDQDFAYDEYPDLRGGYLEEGVPDSVYPERDYIRQDSGYSHHTFPEHSYDPGYDQVSVIQNVSLKT